MNILVIPDSYKGSVSAEEAVQAMKRGIECAVPGANVTALPLADGGEGTMQALVAATGGSVREADVTDPLGRPMRGQYGITGDGKTAIIELAVASGLPLLRPEERNPALATTYGTGQLIRAALAEGVRSFLICLGGSATVDGGTGILRALGFRFLGHDRKELPHGGVALRELVEIDDNDVPEEVRASRFELACDVTNPLLGSHGAAAVFGPQKGADTKMVQELEDALHTLADCMEQKTGIRTHDLSGAGAAGGTAAGLHALLGAMARPGFELVSRELGLAEKLAHTRFDLILTGEGQLDEQTASGKVIAGVCELGKRYHVPVVAVAGAIRGPLSALHERGLTAAFSLVSGPMELEYAMKHGTVLIEQQIGQIIRLFMQVRAD